MKRPLLTKASLVHTGLQASLHLFLIELQAISRQLMHLFRQQTKQLPKLGVDLAATAAGLRCSLAQQRFCRSGTRAVGLDPAIETLNHSPEIRTDFAS
jgi:hypothetical protein